MLFYIQKYRLTDCRCSESFFVYNDYIIVGLKFTYETFFTMLLNEEVHVKPILLYG